MSGQSIGHTWAFACVGVFGSYTGRDMYKLGAAVLFDFVKLHLV